MAKVKRHADHIKMWRQIEEYYKLAAEHSPHQFCVIMADDTSCISLPHFTNRPVKATSTKRRVEFTPWLFHNFSRGELAYVYSLKGTCLNIPTTHLPVCRILHTHTLATTASIDHFVLFHSPTPDSRRCLRLNINCTTSGRHIKGGNRLCTMLWHILRSTKTCGGPAASAREFVYIGYFSPISVSLFSVALSRCGCARRTCTHSHSTLAQRQLRREQEQYQPCFLFGPRQARMVRAHPLPVSPSPVAYPNATELIQMHETNELTPMLPQVRPYSVPVRTGGPHSQRH
jgi:hypothetical protein